MGKIYYVYAIRMADGSQMAVVNESTDDNLIARTLKGLLIIWANSKEEAEKLAEKWNTMNKPAQ